jgi:hypothetical protein
MTTSSSLIKTILHKSLAEGVYRDVVTRSSNYYYYLGKTLSWDNELNPPYPIDSYAYERNARSEIITMKQIGPSDVSFVIPRKNWTSGTVYDMYDDEYCNQILGINIVSGGSGFNSLPTITITGGGGTGASYTPVVLDGQIIDVDFVSRGTGYTSVPTVTVTGGGGVGADLRAVLNLAYSGENNLEDANFYVMTDDFNVYKCLDNNLDSVSTVKPTGTSVSPISTADGYIWKYMYNVPINLRSKFLNDQQIPVVSALTNQFYSNGTVDSVIINNKGSGYTAATLTVTGDGYREEDPVFVNGVTVSTAGANYSSAPTLTFSDPVSDSSAFISAATVFLGQKIYNSVFDFYEIVSPGTLSSSEPTHRLGIVQNGTAALKFVGTRAKGSVAMTTPTISGAAISGTAGQFTCTATTIAVGNLITISGTLTGTGTITGYSTPTTYKVSTITGSGSSVTGFTLTTTSDVAIVTTAGTTTGLTLSNGSRQSVASVSLTGAVREINLNSGGSGYTTAPTITFSGGGGSGAVATAKMNTASGSVLYVTVTNPGDNYTSDPTVVFGTAFPLSTAVLVGEQYFVSNRLYTITGAGTTSSSNPTHTSGSASSGTATVAYAGTPATGSVVRRFGAGYLTVPTVAFSGGSGSGAIAAVNVSKSEAKLYPILDGGQITGVTIENSGIGYSTASIAVSGTGTGAVLTPDLNVGNIASLQANNEILTTAGTINAIKLISGGYGYGVATVSIQGDGTGATATATINTATGRITKINITNPGSGYTFANIVITGNGKAGRARAIMSPFGGHGKNAPDELFSRTLMFYSNVSNDLNQGLEVNNDYRQLGIIKNPRAYGANTRFQGVLGSGCFLVQGAINTTYFPKDTDIEVARVISGTTFYRRYRVVSSTSTAALLQSLDNDVPLINDIFENDAGQTFTASSVSNPTVDKYSGQLMFIDNKAGFTPSDEETVTLRTIIRF